MNDLSRKDFLKKSLLVSGSLLIPRPFRAAEKQDKGSPLLTILYTNDTHARLDPFPSNALEFAGQGGIARRATIVKEIRKRQKHVLLLDAGDVFQGTTWFDKFGGSVDLKLMSKMGYDAMCIGNHEFDNGPDALADTAKEADFPMLAANYHVRSTPLQDIVQRFIVKEYEGLRVGIFGLGIPFKDVISPQLHGDVRDRDPLIWANGMANSLKHTHRCDIVICLSHLGYQYWNQRPGDIDVANKTAGIDLIIGGHTHTFLDEPSYVMNPGGKLTAVTQMGHSGIRLGRVDFYESSRGERPFESRFQYYTIGG